MKAALGYEASPHFKLVSALGAAGALILLVGLLTFTWFEPVTLAGAASARIEGTFLYDQRTHQLGPERTLFAPADDPAGVVDWTSLPASYTVAAGWFDENGQGDLTRPGPPSAQPRVVPVNLAAGDKLPPGDYVFVVGRYSNGRLVQVLGRRPIKVVAR